MQWIPPPGSSGGNADLYLDKTTTIQKPTATSATKPTAAKPASAKPTDGVKMAGPPLGPGGQIMPLPEFMDKSPSASLGSALGANDKGKDTGKNTGKGAVKLRAASGTPPIM